MSDPYADIADRVSPDPYADIAQPVARQPARRPQVKPKKRSFTQDVTGFMANVNRGLGIGDELVAGAKTVGDVFTGKVQGRSDSEFGSALAGRFRANMADQRQTEDSFTEARPMTSALARGVGNAISVAAPVGGGSAAVYAQGSRLGNAARGATTAALSGATYSALDRGTLRERADAATDPAMLGTSALVGGAIGALGPARNSGRLPKVDRAKLKADKNAAYNVVDNSGVKYKPTSVDGLATVIETEMKAANFNASRHPKTASILKDEIQALRGTSPSPTELDQLRQVISRDVIKSGDASEQRLGKIMIAQIDDFMNVAGPKQVIAGDPISAVGAIKKARDLNTRVSKISAVDLAVSKAKRRAGSTGSGGNVDNAIRQNLRSLMEKTPNLTAAEREAFDAAIMGTKGQNTLRQLGKLSPQGNGLMLSGHLLAAPVTGGASALVAGGGALAKIGADRMTIQRVDDLVRLIAAGGQQAAPATRQLTQMLNANPALRQMAAARFSTAAAAGVGASALASSSAARENQ